MILEVRSVIVELGCAESGVEGSKIGRVDIGDWYLPKLLPLAFEIRRSPSLSTPG